MNRLDEDKHTSKDKDKDKTKAKSKDKDKYIDTSWNKSIEVFRLSKQKRDKKINNWKYCN